MNQINILIKKQKINLDITYNELKLNIKNNLYITEKKQKKLIKTLKPFKNYDNIFMDLYNLIEPYYYIKNVNDNILLYNNIINNKYNLYKSWIYYKDNLDKNKSYNTLFINTINNNSDLEDYMLYREITSKYSFEDNTDLVCLNLKKEFIPSNTNKLFKIYNQINKLFFYNYKKVKLQNIDYDFIIINTIVNNTDNYKLILNMIYISLKNLKKDGILRIRIKTINNQLIIDIITILTHYFKNVFISKSLFQNQFDSKCYINCEKYNCTNIKLFTKIINLVNKNNNSNLSKLLKNNNNYNDYSKFLESNSKNKIYLLNKIHECYKNLKNNNKDDIYYRNIQFKTALEFSKNNNLPIKFKYQKEYTDFLKNDKFYNINLNNNIYEFKTNLDNKINIKLEKQNYTFVKLDEIENLLIFYKRVIDTLDIHKYNKIKLIIKKSKFLKNYISEHYIDLNISQAFLKLYEILEIFDLLSKNKNIHSAFHICEAPGQFILSSNHYLKTKTKNKKYNWNAQSLNPINENKDIFGDDYNLIKNYSNNWDFGYDNSGDIMKNQNIKYYSKLSKNIDLLTSDCGISSKTPYDMIYQATVVSKLTFTEILFILHNLPENGNFVIKIFLPTSSQYITSINYLLYVSFKKLYYYKPTLNPSSSEVYIIGKGYKRLSDTNLNKLFEIKDKLKYDFGFIKHLSKDFINQYEECIVFFTHKNINSIKRTLYYYEKLNNEELSDNLNFNNYKYILNKKNYLYVENWMSRFKMSKIKKKDILNTS